MTRSLAVEWANTILGLMLLHQTVPTKRSFGKDCYRDLAEKFDMRKKVPRRVGEHQELANLAGIFGF